MVLSSPRPTIDLPSVTAHVTKLLAGRARASSLHDMVVVDVERDRLLDVARALRDDPVTKCDLYSINAGVDMGNGELRSVTFVRGTTTHVFAMLRTPCTELDPHVPSLTAVWTGANWAERETYDMFGIVFDGHPDLRRVFLEETFPGHPLRKSFMPPRSDARGG
ncbi:MAG: NADH-quinone oxidoreductase subunit C [Chloroflexota bacterium]|nr:NADH-quinone oxidoreductase subunit C [Chloroflexota bacterium]MDE3193459.1 NADH-quinone oxidoreductase subunit C [Chloroflexota bacterium]